MSEEVQTMVQVLELTGRGLSGVMKGIRLSAKGASKGAELIDLKWMQLKMKLHYASTGTHDTMLLKDLEKLTGGQYDILNIPFEDEKSLIGFYDRLKKVSVSFAELPDLNLGDGYTQIAYNPQDAARIKTVVEYYKDKLEVEAAEISLEQYERMGDEKARAVLNELAEKGYQQETQINLLQKIRERNKDNNYVPISIDIETLLKKEDADSYICYVPGTKHKQTVTIKKEDCLLFDDRKVIYTHLRKDDPATKNIKGNYNKVVAKYKKMSERTRLDDMEILPDFTKGQDQTGSAPEHEPLPFGNRSDARGISEMEDLEKTLLQRPKNQSEEKVYKALSNEHVKGKAGSPDYLPVTINLEKQLVAESPNLYIAKIPDEGTPELGEETTRLISIPKEDAVISKDGRQAQIFLDKKGKTEVSLHDVKSGGRKSDVLMSNEEIAKTFAGKNPGIEENKTMHKSLELIKGKVLKNPTQGGKVI
ncbi:MAG: DUF3801 domain-containing protein [Roseburia sp.]|nr:DUF3801 domain-containing protein [Roseburia sp.]